MDDQKEPTLDLESSAIPLMTPTSQDDEDDGEPRDQRAKKLTQRIREKWKVVLEAVVIISFLPLLWMVYAAVPTVFYVLKPILQVKKFPKFLIVAI